MFLFFQTNHHCSTTLGRICIKLVVVMGVTWLADVLSWAHGVWFNGYSSLWIITDLINALQGVFIFIVIGCQPQVTDLCALIHFVNKSIIVCDVHYQFRFQMYSSKSGDRKTFSSDMKRPKVATIILIHHKLPHRWVNPSQTIRSPHQMRKC